MRSLAATIAVIVAGSASADLLTLNQRYRIAPFNPDFNRFVDIQGTIDTAGLSGVGLEYVPIISNNLSVWMAPGTYLAGGIVGAGQDPYAEIPGNLRAEFQNGVFTNNIITLRDPNDTGAGWQIINDGFNSSVVTISAGNVFWGFSVLFWHRYTLESSSLTPAPGAITTLAIGLAATRRRRA